MYGYGEAANCCRLPFAELPTVYVKVAAIALIILALPEMQY